jgi:hypothetical protein
MVYLGPVEPRSLRVKNPNSPSEVRAVVQSNAIHPVGSHDELQPNTPPGFVERRKQNRRKSPKSPMLETRAGKDRRKGNSTISISV